MMAGPPQTQKDFCDNCDEYRNVYPVRVDIEVVSNVKRYYCKECKKKQ